MLPVFYWGALPAMVSETIVIPLVMGESKQLFKRLTQLIIWPNFTLGPLLLGFIWSFIYGLKTSFREGAWFVVGFIFVLIQCLFVDLDGIVDTFLLLVFVSIGLGYLASSLQLRHANIGVVLMIILLTANGVWELKQFREVEYEYPNYVIGKIKASEKAENVRIGLERWQTDKFWNKYIPNSCHYRLSVDEINWITQTPQGLKGKRCGKWSMLNAYFSKSTE